MTRDEELLRQRLRRAEVVGYRVCAVCGRKWPLTRRQDSMEQYRCSRACANRERHTECARRYRIGTELRTLREWATYRGMCLRTLRNRVYAGQTIVEALRPPRPYGGERGSKAKSALDVAHAETT